MNTLVIKVPDKMAREIAKATDLVQMPSHEAFAFEAVRLVLRSVLGTRRGRPYKHRPVKPAHPTSRVRRRTR